ncbi:MAG: UxaA family hydrolase, partial [Deinococcota bacterium]|nr:UxaA family hydrolase [Deinococcota bacterium]
SNGERPNNLELLLRTLAGFIVHPNVGAVLIVDDGAGAVTNPMLRTFLKEHAYPLHDVPHRFLTLGSFEAGLEQGEATVKNWLEAVNATQRTQEPADQLKIALQCGGSDAFSGISGNPLASWVAREIIRYGGAANLAETDELIGAEPYLLQKVRDLTTAQAFLAMVARFKERASWHGTTAEGNPSGGNKYRGLYNIVLKSIGAAMKRHPDVRLDYVIDYGERMLRPGYYFMDSPGNDLESIAGQVASGCNMIFFITGNGSITNFPFAPTIKVVTTTRRYELLQNEMDVNAGAYLDGTPMDVLGAEMLALTLEVASGKRSAGEKAGHAQVQIWRDWRQTDSSKLELLLHQPEPKGIPLGVKTEPANDRWSFTAIRSAHGHSTDQLGLILPTSLCAGQVARMTAERLNHKGLGREQGLSRFVALVHTEGCGVSGGSSEEIYTRTLLGYLTHPLVKHCLLLEHGCEKTHNDYMRHRLDQLGFDAGRVGWASIQLDGGIQRVMAKIEHWFEDALARAEAPAHDLVGLECLRLGLLSAGPVPANVARSLANLTRTIVAAGGTVVVPDAADLLTSVYLDGTLEGQQAEPSLAYGQRALAAGFHIMETPTQHWVETLTGLGATGVEIMLAHVSDHPMQSHPLVPLLQVMIKEVEQGRYAKDLDLILRGASDRWAALMLQRLVDVATHKYLPKLYAQGNTDFQFTRGLLGISM